MKKDKLKDKLLEELERTPIVSVACEKIGISRNTYYRWLNEENLLKQQAEKSLGLGIELVNDVAESNVLSGIKNKDAGYTKFWLTHRHPGYMRSFPISWNSEAHPSRVEEAFAKASEEVLRWMKRWTALKKKK